MRALTLLRMRLHSLFRSNQLDADLDEELQYHLERQIELNVAAGMAPDDAVRAARLAFGGVQQHKEECRDARGLRLLESTAQDVRYALRALGRSPGFTAVAILSLALGIGANTTIFTLVNAVLLRPLPYPDSVRLVVLREQALGSSVTVAVHPLNFLEWRARAHAFDALALVQAIPANVLGADGAEQVAQVQATSELFHVFGVSPTLGRTFTADETRPGGDGGVVVLGHGFWQRRFGGDAHALGKRLEVSGAGLTIVGVAPPGLRIGLSEPDIYTPLPIDPAKPDATGSRSFQCYGRLKLGISLDTARSEMAVIASALARRYPLDEGYGVFVSTLHDYLVADGRYALQLLMGVVAAVLLIACVNLAGLLMARGLGRRTELAVRVSLGASRGRLVRQLTIESLTLASLGGVAALVVASWATRALVALAAGVLTVGSTEPIRLEATSVAFTMGLAALTALVFGLVPAWQASRVEPHASLASRSRGTTADRRHHRMRRGLVVVQVALSVVLLVGAGLLLRSFTALAHVDPGFDPSGTVTMRIFLGDRPGAERVALLERILERITTLPGVRAASTIQFLPLAGMQCGTGFWLEGQTPGDPSGALPTDCSLVSPRFFDAMRIPILQGRAFDRRDRADSPRAVVVNRSFARRYFPGRQATGRRVLVAGPNQAWAEIIGVSDDIRHNGLTAQPAPTVFLLHAQAPGYITNLIVRTAGDPSVAAPAIERAIHDVDRTQAVSAVKTMEQYVDDSLARPRLYASLVGAFAALAATLAFIGIYGVIAYTVNQRTQEIGIRMALGAARQTVFRVVLFQGLMLVLGGLAIGLAAAIAVRGLLSSLLFGVRAGDPATYAGAGGLLLLVSLAVAAIPAYRAACVDPMSALKHE